MFVKPASGNEDRSRAGVGKDVIDLIEGLGRVDGNVDRAETQNSEVSYGPLGTILGEGVRLDLPGGCRSPAKPSATFFTRSTKVCCRDVVPLALGAVIERVLFVVT